MQERAYMGRMYAGESQDARRIFSASVARAHTSRTAPARTEKCPSLVSDVLLSHGLTPQYHRRSGA